MVYWVTKRGLYNGPRDAHQPFPDPHPSVSGIKDAIAWQLILSNPTIGICTIMYDTDQGFATLPDVDLDSSSVPDPAHPFRLIMQDNWRLCNKCHGLAFAGNPSLGRCPAGGDHEHGGSFNYMLAHDAPPFGQDNWRWCNKCQGLAFAGNPSLGRCPAGGDHDHGASFNYILAHDVPPFGQDNWRWCNKCQGLAFAGSPPFAFSCGTLSRRWRS